MDILFIGKKGDAKSEIAADYFQTIYPKAKIVFGEKKKKFPKDLLEWKGDYVISYLSPWLIPAKLLENASKGAINWHPGPPEYPGIGCTNFAIYNNEKTFGITCHYMLEKVDSGKIIQVKRFSILPNDTVYSITQKCYALILCSFFEIIGTINQNKKLPVSDEKWQRKPYTRKELDELSKIDPDMDKKEVERRVKATTFKKPWAFTVIQGKKFHLDESQ